MPELPWRDDDALEYPGVVIELASEPELRQGESRPDRFILGKSKAMLADMMSATSHLEVTNIVDLGIYKGGSAVFFNECFRPRKLVAIDLQPAPSALTAYAEAQASDALEVHDLVDQADGARLEEICDAAFGEESIDLIVDDASHLYKQSRETFSYLFPRLRENGCYIIEDWGWAHWPGPHWQHDRGGKYFSEEPPLSNLLVEIMLASASRQNLVSRIEVTGRAAYVVRGSAATDAPLDLDQLALNRGDPLSWVGGSRKAEA